MSASDHTDAPPAEAFFLSSPSGRLFVMFHPAAPGARKRDPVLFVPPFGEEMNKSRRMVALQARRLAASGVAVMVPDLLGTGDSEGDFGEASWDAWRRNVEVCSSWLANRTGRAIVLWALRAGALLLPGLMAGSGSAPVARLLLWQPVLEGRAYIQQLFRLGLVSSLAGDRPRTSASELRARLDVSGRVEIAGYSLSRELVQALEDAALTSLEHLPGGGVVWLQVHASQGRALGDDALALTQRWRDEGVEVRVRSVQGAPFWATQEIVTVPDLIDSTLEALSTP
jgi:exosortase A-associated hydrolase 2